ncbi:Chloroperoxidase [Lentinula raphanica]|uniref:Chloroperoxidase n=1 Tax=Lentinula raphanica TaxID=153919 RepID=A0AA38UFC0_9AGAR|nr:Chloroperoxidase [Lentinula raphanica]KAJ3839459.1 Chloroperoxidase [Lentinula raphanica]KAJ3973423.1 Chloroperoxidase [Lentinula raphanica]
MSSDHSSTQNLENSLPTMEPSATSTVFRLPPGHPPVPDHEHFQGTCPRSGKHEFCPPQKGDVRSVCPALNTMANHGFIPRDGRNLTFSVLFHGLKACYGVSTPLAILLVTGGFLLIKRSPIRIPFLSNLPLFRAKNPDGSLSPAGVIDLHLIGLHDGVEHDASLVHLNTPDGQKYGPVQIQEDWVPMLVGDIQPPVGNQEEPLKHHQRDVTADTVVSTSSDDSTASSKTLINSPEYLTTLVDEADVGRMRARRQKEILPKKLDGVHAEIARGEMAIILGVWNSKYQSKTDKKQDKSDKAVSEKQGIPLSWLLQWLAEERLPDMPISPEAGKDVDGSTQGMDKATTMWRPNHTQSLMDVVNRTSQIRKVTEALESEGKS